MSEGESSSGAAPAAGTSEAPKPEEKKKNKKLLRLLTVMAYLSTVSGTAFMLSLYYLFLWTPKVALGGKALVQDPPPPSTLALFFPQMAPEFAARVAAEEAAYQLPGDTGESQVQATPKLSLPATDEMAGKKREARSTVMETTQQSITLSPNGGGNAAYYQAQPLQTSPSPPLPQTHRTNPKPGEHPRRTTPHPHPAEIGVRA
ncbi:hypothetical protein J437_LFUL009300 [Ladona fulva]|uniref:InaF motif containing 2 n=1 Tax=Ladona fulva TaxID=123851 RepID=A0A8K0K580_LADFU|nr:hypothetical protein J437_LFUL009300 [Ladona fulva]